MCWYLSLILHKLHGKLKGRVVEMYDIMNIKLRLSSYCYIQCKLANIIIPPFMDIISYKKAFQKVKRYIAKKCFDVRFSKENLVNLYYEDTYVNNVINNILIHHLLAEK